MPHKVGQDEEPPPNNTEQPGDSGSQAPGDHHGQPASEPTQPNEMPHQTTNGADNTHIGSWAANAELQPEPLVVHGQIQDEERQRQQAQTQARLDAQAEQHDVFPSERPYDFQWLPYDTGAGPPLFLPSAGQYSVESHCWLQEHPLHFNCVSSLTDDVRLIAWLQNGGSRNIDVGAYWIQNPPPDPNLNPHPLETHHPLNTQIDGTVPETQPSVGSATDPPLSPESAERPQSPSRQAKTADQPNADPDPEDTSVLEVPTHTTIEHMDIEAATTVPSRRTSSYAAAVYHRTRRPAWINLPHTQDMDAVTPTPPPTSVATEFQAPSTIADIETQVQPTTGPGVVAALQNLVAPNETPSRDDFEGARTAGPDSDDSGVEGDGETDSNDNQPLAEAEELIPILTMGSRNAVPHEQPSISTRDFAGRDLSIGEAGPGPSTEAHRQTARALEHEEVIDEHYEEMAAAARNRELQRELREARWAERRRRTELNLDTSHLDDPDFPECNGAPVSPTSRPSDVAAPLEERPEDWTFVQGTTREQRARRAQEWTDFLPGNLHHSPHVSYDNILQDQGLRQELRDTIREAPGPWPESDAVSSNDTNPEQHEEGSQLPASNERLPTLVYRRPTETPNLWQSTDAVEPRNEDDVASSGSSELLTMAPPRRHDPQFANSEEEQEFVATEVRRDLEQGSLLTPSPPPVDSPTPAAAAVQTPLNPPAPQGPVRDGYTVVRERDATLAPPATPRYSSSSASDGVMMVPSARQRETLSRGRAREREELVVTAARERTRERTNPTPARAPEPAESPDAEAVVEDQDENSSGEIVPAGDDEAHGQDTADLGADNTRAPVVTRTRPAYRPSIHQFQTQAGERFRRRLCRLSRGGQGRSRIRGYLFSLPFEHILDAVRWLHNILSERRLLDRSGLVPDDEDSLHSLATRIEAWQTARRRELQRAMRSPGSLLTLPVPGGARGLVLERDLEFFRHRPPHFPLTYHQREPSRWRSCSPAVGREADSYRAFRGMPDPSRPIGVVQPPRVPIALAYRPTDRRGSAPGLLEPTTVRPITDQATIAQASRNGQSESLAPIQTEAVQLREQAEGPFRDRHRSWAQVLAQASISSEDTGQPSTEAHAESHAIEQRRYAPTWPQEPAPSEVAETEMPAERRDTVDPGPDAGPLATGNENKVVEADSDDGEERLWMSNVGPP